MRRIDGISSFFFVFLLVACSAAHAKEPNIVVIWGDDIGQSNISAYTKGVMGYRTPNIDRVANEYCEIL